MKRQKYSNGGGATQYKDSGQLLDSFESKQKGNRFGSGSLNLSPTTKLNASIFKNQNVTVNTIGMEKQIGKTTVGASTNPFENSVSIKKGGLRFEVGKPRQGNGLRYGITYSKKI
tara:strand:+ start:3415 stop:3759 length:345 start_codon:yes stop_codon:yes gene_type:complete